jgi:tyrosyl-tRNA synthetase
MLLAAAFSLNSKETTMNNQDHFLQTMTDRGFIAQCTNLAGLEAELSKGQITAYVGFDATADSLHVGHLVSLMSMRWLAKHGHNVIALVGGATTMVGDPSFRNSARPLLAADTIASNIASITANIRTVMGDHANQLTIVNNRDWLGNVGLIEFMRDVGSHFSIARMLTMESVKSRLCDNGTLSMLEFTYQMLQSADFLHLFREKGCKLQMGGSDQWGNIVNGIELVRRSADGDVFGLTTQLLTTANGQKMGKTQNGAVWLDANKLPAFEFWQFWRNVNDADVTKFLRLFTEIDLDEILMLTKDGGVALNTAKIVLANAITAIVHGTTTADECQAQAAALFDGDRNVVTHRFQNIPVDGIGVVDLIKRLEFGGSSSDIRRLIDGNAIRINGEPVTDPRQLVTPDKIVQIAVGKRKRAVVKLSGSP